LSSCLLRICPLCICLLGVRGRGGGAQSGQSGEPGKVSADAKTTITAENPVAVEHRQAGKLDRKAVRAVVDRPDNGEPAPGIVRGDCACDLALGIEGELGCQVAPGTPELSRRAGADQRNEFVRAERDATLGIHLPHETERMAPFGGCFR